MEEVEAIRRCQNGETEAFGLLVKTYGAAAFRSAYLFVGNREYAEELKKGNCLSLAGLLVTGCGSPFRKLSESEVNAEMKSEARR